MKITAIKTFRNKHAKGELIRSGTTVDVDNEYGQSLILTGLAVDGTKALKEYEDKMMREYQDKKLPITQETPEERTLGLTGPTKKAETPEQRTQGKNNAKPVEEKPGPAAAAMLAAGERVASATAKAEAKVEAKAAPGKPAAEETKKK